MKRRIPLSIALALSVLVSLVSLPATAQGQQRMRFRADTGIFMLGPNQVLRVTAAFDFDNDGDVDGGDLVRVRFRRMQYGQGACNGGVCKLASVTDLIIDPIRLMPGEAASMDITQGGFRGVRGVVQSSRRNVVVTAAIINTITGETTSHIIVANTDGDWH